VLPEEPHPFRMASPFAFAPGWVVAFCRPALLVLRLLRWSAPLRGAVLADLLEPFDRVGAGLVVVAVVGHGQGGLAVGGRCVAVAEGGQGVTGVHADPEVVRPAGQVRLHAGPSLLAPAALPPRHPHVPALPRPP